MQQEPVINSILQKDFQSKKSILTKYENLFKKKEKKKKENTF